MYSRHVSVLPILFFTSALVIALANVVVKAQTSEPPELPMYSYIASGLSPTFPITYVYKHGHAVAVLHGTADGASQLNKILDGSLKPEAAGTTDELREAKLFAKVLAEHGISLPKIIDHTHAYTLIDVEIKGQSAGVCAPCTGRHNLIVGEINGKDNINAAFKTVQLTNRNGATH